MGLFGIGKKKDEKKKKETEEVKEEKELKKEKENIGSFVGFVLLSEPMWDREHLVKDFKEEWGADISDNEEDDDEQYKDILLSEQGDMRLAVSFMPMPVPNGEAEYYAEANYLWPEAVKITKGHKAQILVAVLGDTADLLERGKLFTKAVAVCLKQKYAVGVYTDGAVFEPAFYCQSAMLMKQDELPIMNWVWFGLYRNEKQAGIYTYGMKKFGKDEMEVYVDLDKADLNRIRNFLVGVAAYVLEYNVILRDGETIGFSADQKIPITRNKGIAVEGDTLKIGFEG